MKVSKIVLLHIEIICFVGIGECRRIEYDDVIDLSFLRSLLQITPCIRYDNPVFILIDEAVSIEIAPAPCAIYI